MQQRGIEFTGDWCTDLRKENAIQSLQFHKLTEIILTASENANTIGFQLQ